MWAGQRAPDEDNAGDGARYGYREKADERGEEVHFAVDTCLASGSRRLAGVSSFFEDRRRLIRGVARDVSRRPFAVRLALLMVAAAAGLFVAPPARSANAPPNILIIVTDDQRSGTLGVMPATRRWFGAHGETFPQGFVTTPLCCPSRASIFTGLYAHNHGVLTNGSGQSLPQELTVQRYLSDAGYTTGIIGKYLNSWPIEQNPPYFDRWAIDRGGQYSNPSFNVDGTVRTLRGYSTNIIARRAVDVLRSFEQEDSRPWFLYVAPKAPHLPATPAARYANSPVPRWTMAPSVDEQDRSDKPPWVRARRVSPEHTRALRADQLRTLMSVDDLVQDIANTLATLDERRQTLAFFLSDNGFLWAEHGLSRKAYPYTESIRVPLFMRWPGHVQPGSRDGRFATNVDLAPTILDAAGLTPGAPMDGKSLLASWTRGHLFTEYFGNSQFAVPGWESIRTRRIHYVEYYDDNQRSHVIFREYYRLDRDPWELTNRLRDGNPDNSPDIKALHALLVGDRACSGSTCP